MEASKVNSPSKGYTVTVPDFEGGPGDTITVEVDGKSTTGDVKKGNFR